MDPTTFANEQANQLLDAQAHIWNHVFYFLNSMALKCAIQLGIPDAIQKHDKPITLSELALALGIPPIKAPFLNRLMRLLVHSNFFSKKKSPELGEFVFDLTTSSQLLLKDHPLSQAPFALAMLDQIMVDPAHHLGSWLTNDSKSPFHITHGRSVWDYVGSATKFNEYLNQAMASDARFVAKLMLTTGTQSNKLALFKGVESLVDVGGGDGIMAKAIVEAYPKLKCVVLDLPHVVEGLHRNGLNLEYFGGDMFQAIPPAQVVLLQWILHDWGDEDCIKILEQCKKAISSKEQGGKVIIIDMVVVEDQNDTQNILIPKFYLTWR